MKTITVRIKDGKVEITTSGFAGRECLAATAELEKALGHKTADTPTREMAATTATAPKLGAK